MYPCEVGFKTKQKKRQEQIPSYTYPLSKLPKVSKESLATLRRSLGRWKAYPNPSMVFQKVAPATPMPHENGQLACPNIRLAGISPK